MGTTFSEIINGYAMVQIDDTRLYETMSTNPALFYRKMAQYMRNAIPRFTKPAEVREWLKHEDASYDDYTQELNGEEESIVLHTGKTGYELVSVVFVREDGYGGTEYLPATRSDYDPETGDIAVSGGVPEDAYAVSADLYKDGVFDRILSHRMKYILGLCVQYEWESRFVNAFLVQTPKIKDKSFDVGSEANYIRTSGDRLRMLQQNLDAEQNAFEQECYYGDVVLGNGWRKPIIMPERK